MMKKSVAVFAAIAIVGSLCGCSKDACLKKYHFNSEAEFMKVYKETKDKDEVIKLHSIGKECGCKGLVD